MKYFTCFSVYFLIFGLLFPGPSNLAASSFKEEFNREISLEPGGSFSLSNVEGRIEVSGWDEPRVQINAVKRVSGFSSLEKAQKWLDKIEIRVIQSGNSIEVETKYPKKTGNGFSLSDIFDGVKRLQIQMEVSYRVKLPRRTDVRLKSVDGDISLAEVGGDIKADAVDGSIEMRKVSGVLKAVTVDGDITIDQLQGSANFTTVDGNLNVSLDEIGPGGNMSFTTVDGNVTLAVKPSLAVDMDISTVDGRMNVDLPITVQGEITKRRINGKINGGGPLIKISTVDGNVKIIEI
ncbi:MAG TPA: DUF4097 family beta strand repeat-containing protein [archaeon]|nr:DUF4097 family beta strand repeat-containing protein [archaeon]